MAMPGAGRPELGRDAVSRSLVGGARLVRVWGGGSHRRCTDSGADADSHMTSAESDRATRTPHDSPCAPVTWSFEAPASLWGGHRWGRSRGHRPAGMRGSERGRLCRVCPRHGVGGWRWCRPVTHALSLGGQRPCQGQSLAVAEKPRGRESREENDVLPKRGRGSTTGLSLVPPRATETARLLHPAPHEPPEPGARAQLLTWAAPPEGAPAAMAAVSPSPSPA